MPLFGTLFNRTPSTPNASPLPPPAAATPATGGAPAVKVPIIHPSQFDAAIANGTTVVEFFSYGCGYCQRAMPEVHKAAQQMAGSAKFVMVSVNDIEGKSIGLQYGLSLYPTFAVFKNGQHVGTFARDGGNDVTASYVKAGVKSILGG